MMILFRWTYYSKCKSIRFVNSSRLGRDKTARFQNASLEKVKPAVVLGKIVYVRMLTERTAQADGQQLSLLRFFKKSEV